MRFMKKFGALALATVAVATSVWYVTPAVQALASAKYELDKLYNYTEADGYVQNDEGKYIYTEDGMQNYTKTPSGTGEETKEKIKITYSLKQEKDGIGIFTNAYGSIYVEPKEGYARNNYDYGTISYKSSDESIAIIRDSGAFDALIKGVKAGKTTITATVTYKDGKTVKIGDVEVRVYDRTSKTVVDASPSSSSSSSSSTTPASVPTKVVAPDGQTLLQYTAIGAKNTLMAAPEGIVPQGAILAQYEVKEDSQTYEVAKTILGLRVPNATLAKVLDFNLSAKQGTLIHQLNGRVAISFDIPANFTVPAGYVPRVYRFNDNGTVTACETILDKGKVVFGTDHFSTFALVLEKAPKAAKAK